MPWLSLLFGSLVGVSLALTGGGGALFSVPMLVYGLGMPVREAVSVSLVSVGVTAFVGFLGKWRKGEAEVRTGLLFAVAGMLGAPPGTWIAGQLPESLLMMLFAALMLLIAGMMWRKGVKSALSTPVCNPAESTSNQPLNSDSHGPTCQRDPGGQLILTSRCMWLLILVGVVAGILSGMFGVGGGFLIVPALMLFSGMSMVRAVGTSLLVISLVSVSGIVSHVLGGQSVPGDVAGLFVIGGLAGLWLGQRVSHRISPSVLQRIFAVVILLVAVFVILKNVRG
jgi:uncharacterized membrane protein YfcA